MQSAIYIFCGLLPLKDHVLATTILSSMFAILLIINLYNNRKSLFKKLPWKTLLVGMLWGIIALCFEIGLIALMLLIHHATFKSINTVSIVKMVSQFPIFSAYIILVAPLLEELIFRQSMFALLFSWFKTHCQMMQSSIQWLLAALVVGFIFAIVHGDNSVWEYVLISMMLQFLYQRYHDIRVSMISHLVFNGATLFLLAI